MADAQAALPAEPDNHHNALACEYCAGPLKRELEDVHHRLTEAQETMEKILGEAAAFSEGFPESDAFTRIMQLAAAWTGPRRG